jgi:hypothetical protein
VLLRRSPTEASWGATLRLRDAEARYRDDRQWRHVYCQLRAQSETWLGNHAAALRWADSCGGSWGDSAATLPPGTRAVDAVAFIARAADTARVVMVNERHHAASDRLLTLRLLPALWQRGYRYFAAEAFDWKDTLLNRRPYAAVGVTGGYVDEPVFGEIVREARRLGFTLVPYEMEPSQSPPNDSLSPQQRRDLTQARNLRERIFAADPNAKVFIHAGYAHIQERPTATWFPMASYLRELTGIDPVTVDQTVLAEASTPEREHPAYRAAMNAGLVGTEAVVLVDRAERPIAPIRFHAADMQAVSPRTMYTRGRPRWMTFGTRRHGVDVAVPECATRHCIVEVRLAGESDAAVALDRTEVRGDTARLFIPRHSRARIQVLTPAAEVLRAFDAPGVP